MLPIILGGAALGLAKSEFVDRPQAEKQRKLQAEVMRYSPWTHMTPDMNIKEADPFGSALQGGMAGGMMGQNMQSAASADKANNALANYYASQGPQPQAMGANPWFSMAQPNYVQRPAY